MVLRLFAIGLCLLCPGWAAADDWLDLIPAAALEDQQPAAETTTSATGFRKNSLRLSAVGYDWRTPFPAYSHDTPNWGTSAQSNMLGRHDVGKLSARWNLRLQSGTSDDNTFDAQKDSHLFIKEAYLSSTTDRLFVDGGRINQRYGVASGFNPTDFYRGHSALPANNADPGSRREDRLGTLALRLTRLWSGTSATLIFSPDLHAGEESLAGGKDLVGLLLNRTNNSNRATLSLEKQLPFGLTGEALLHLEEEDPTLGMNLSLLLGDSWLIQVETSLGYRLSLRNERCATAQDKDWLVQSAAGISWTSSADLSLTFEFHYNQAGLSASDWNHWFDQARVANHNPALRGSLWFVRQLARERQEPLSRVEFFARFSWNDALVNDLNLSALAQSNPYDTSLMLQLQGIYSISDALQLTTRLISNSGAKNSEYGSLANSLTTVCQLEYFF